MNDNILLQKGVTISDCARKLRTFCERDLSYRNYDLVLVKEDNSLVISDVRLANRMVARMKPEIIQSVMNRAGNINSHLAHIPPGLELSNNVIPWADLENLFRVALGPQVRAARATKILHKKRPYLIPILDSVVVSYCRAVERPANGDEASRIVEWVRIIKADIDKNLNTFRSLIATTNLKITVVRAYDILVWAYSGEYQKKFGVPPVWQRNVN